MRIPLADSLNLSRKMRLHGHPFARIPAASPSPPRALCGAMEQERWEHFEHMADIGVRGIAPTRAAAFEQAALALTAVLTDPGGIAEREEVTVRCKAPDAEMLLVDWLNALVYEMDVRKMLFSRYRVVLSGNGPDGIVLEGHAWGEAVRRAEHEPAVEVKGATFTGLRVARQDDGCWVAQCVVDV